ncbi:unnamed protein product [Rotaria sp. Silwood1]|nr:unnamed protein product [Rotaria sp. Silwood1]
MTYSKDIKDKSLTMLIPTTGDRWPALLDYFYDSSQTNGLYERFLYWIIGKKNFVHEHSLLNEELPSLEYLYITRMLIGNRIYEYDDAALNYLRPILYKMRSNDSSYEGLFNVPKNKRAEACERRGADLIERIAVIIQNIFDTLKVLEPIKSINFNVIQQDTLNEIKANIDLVDFSVALARFGIIDIDLYYATLKKIDTKNTTYLTSHGMSILEEKPYNNLKIDVNKDAIIQPTSERFRELPNEPDANRNNDKENVTMEKVDDSTIFEHDVEHALSPKRRRALTGKGKEYKEQQSKSKKKKN